MTAEPLPRLDGHYRVRDAQGREWGSVHLEWPHEECLSGRLVPAPAFEQVRGLFRRHAELLRNPVRPEEVEAEDTGRQIAQLAVTLIDQSTGKVYPAGTVFVSEELLFTCTP